MANESNIQWTDATHNVARGCTKVVDVTDTGEKVSDCLFCYMYRDSMNGKRYKPNIVKKTKTVFDLPLRYKKKDSDVWEGDPLIFTSSLTDIFHKDIDSFRNEYWDIARKTPHLIKQLLTKRPERIDNQTPNDFLNGELSDTIWMGTSCGNKWGVRRIQQLADSIFTGIKFISIEPLWTELNIPDELLSKFQWIIIGGESGFGSFPQDPSVKYGYRICKLEWIENIVKQCQRLKIAVFVKQMGAHLSKELKMSDRHGGDISEFPEYLQVREFPKA